MSKQVLQRTRTMVNESFSKSQASHVCFLKIFILVVLLSEHQNTFAYGFLASRQPSYGAVVKAPSSSLGGCCGMRSFVRREQWRSRWLPTKPSYPAITTTTSSSSTSPFMDMETSDFGTAMPEPVSVYESIGIEEGKLALGVKPEEFLNYIGTREDLLEKTMNDIPSIGREKAETEVDKFLMDAEMVNMYIQFQKEVEKNPDFKVPTGPEDTGEGFFSIRTVLILYIVYAFGNSGIGFFRNWVAKQEELGTWTGTNIPFIDEWIENTSKAAVEATSAATDAVAVISPEMIHDVIANAGGMTS